MTLSFKEQTGVLFADFLKETTNTNSEIREKKDEPIGTIHDTRCYSYSYLYLQFTVYHFTKLIQ